MFEMMKCMNTRGTKRCAVAFTAALTLLTLGAAYAEEMELPTATEVQYFSPEAQQFYAAGMAALDVADYMNAYNMLSKSAALQPAAVNLNRIVARLALYHGRQSSAEDALDFYETALFAYGNILRIPTLSADMRRQITNETKQAQMERDNLATRDTLREAVGTAFLLDWNRKYAVQPPRKAGATVSATAETTAPATVNIGQYFQPAAGTQPGFGATGVPGMAPGAGFGQPGMPQPGMPYNAPGTGPGAGVPPPMI